MNKRKNLKHGFPITLILIKIKIKETYIHSQSDDLSIIIKMSPFHLHSLLTQQMQKNPHKKPNTCSHESFYNLWTQKSPFISLLFVYKTQHILEKKA